MRPHIVQPASSPKPVGPYSHAVRVGDLLFCSGQIPLTKDGKLVEGGIAEQTRQVLQNVSAILQDQALTCENVVKSTVFMTNLAEFAEMNAVYQEFFQQNFPARARQSRLLRSRAGRRWRSRSSPATRRSQQPHHLSRRSKTECACHKRGAAVAAVAIHPKFRHLPAAFAH